MNVSINFKKIALLLISGCIFLMMAACAETENTNQDADGEGNDYPSKEIELIVPFGAGGGTDAIARAVASELEKELGETFVVTNQTSANGIVGSNEIASSNNDGYTLGVFSNTDVASFVYMIQTGVEFELDSFTYLGGLNETGDLLVVPAESDINTLDEFVEKAKSNPGELTVALPSQTQEVNISLMKENADIDVTSVVYDSGNNVLADLIGEHIDGGILSASFAAQAEDQNLKVLGVMLDERLESIPDVPTFAEQGYDVSNPAARLLVGPADLPADVVEKVETALTNAYEGELAGNLERMGEVPRNRISEELNSFLESDFQMREEILKE